jgi:hypothetical protein
MKLSTSFSASLASLALGFALVAAARAEPGPDAASIRHVMMSTFDKPEARLTVEPVVVVGPHAVAGWSQGERGGRALLFRHGTDWHITLCAGDGLKEAQVLREAGISASDADTLVAALAAAEAKLPAAQLARFSTFDGVIRMEANGQHPPEHKH